MDRPVQWEGNESETRRFPSKLVYPLSFVEHNCTTYISRWNTFMIENTACFIYYHKSVLHLRKRMFHVRVCRCSTDLRKILGHLAYEINKIQLKRLSHIWSVLRSIQIFVITLLIPMIIFLLQSVSYITASKFVLHLRKRISHDCLSRCSTDLR